MGADVLGQFIEAVLCFGVGAYFGVKIAFTEVIGECSGKALRFILELLLGVSYILCIFAVIFWFSDGNLKYYHFVIEAIGALALLPLARKFFRKYKRGIQSVWLWLLGKNADVDNQEAIAKTIKSKRIRKKNLSADYGAILQETEQKSVLKFAKRRISAHMKEKSGGIDATVQKSGLKIKRRRNSVRDKEKTHKNNETVQKSAVKRMKRDKLSLKLLKNMKKGQMSRHTAESKTDNEIAN